MIRSSATHLNLIMDQFLVKLLALIMFHKNYQQIILDDNRYYLFLNLLRIIPFFNHNNNPITNKTMLIATNIHFKGVKIGAKNCPQVSCRGYAAITTEVAVFSARSKTNPNNGIKFTSGND